jgi:hypothetical protein
MEPAAEGHTLTIGDQRVAMAISDPQTEARLRERIAKRSGAISVRLAPASASDVEGHVFQAAQRSVAINLQMDEDDVEGHAISLRFPTLEEADKFRRNLIAAGVLAGTLVVGSAGAIAITSQPAATDVSPVQATQAYERPAGHGMLPGADIAAPEAAAPAQAAAVTGVDPATGQPARTGLQQGVDLGTAAAATSANAATGIDPVTGKPWQSGFQENADSGTPSNLSGTQSAERPAGSGPLEGVDR